MPGMTAHSPKGRRKPIPFERRKHFQRKSRDTHTNPRKSKRSNIRKGVKFKKKKARSSVDSMPYVSRWDILLKGSQTPASQKEKDSWIKVVKKSTKKLQTIYRGLQKDGRKANPTRSPKDSARYEIGNMVAQSCRGGVKHTAKLPLTQDSVLLVCPFMINEQA